MLDRDPRLDIAATRAIAAVIAAGRYRSRAELDAMLRDIAAACRIGEFPTQLPKFPGKL